MDQNIESVVLANETNYTTKEPPKNKLDKVDNAVVNKQDDNSYEEPVTDNTNKQQDTGKQTETKKGFEYTDSGEFENDTHLTDTNSNDDFL